MKSKWLFKFLISGLFPILSNAQVIYVDPTVAAAMGVHGFSLREGLNSVAKEQSRLQKAQTFVSTQVALVNRVQEKIYKGLSEVSGTISNGIQVKNILEQLDGCRSYSKNINKLIRRQPQYAIFGAKASQKAYEQILKIASEVNSVIEGGGKNLMTAGDRFKLLDSIESKVRTLKIWLITIQLGLENAERIGFWKSINPFQGYINTDKDIVENIMQKYKHNF